MELKDISKKVYPQVAKIYAQGIATGIATFETEVPSWDHWDKTHLEFGRITAFNQANNRVLGWAALSPVSSRCVYGGVAEVSIYVDPVEQGKGVGKFLLSRLVSISEENGIWTLQSGIFKQNESSIALHKKCGFRIIGFKEKIGQLNGQWFDNILLERRSHVIGR